MSEHDQGGVFSQLSIARRLDRICDRFEQLWFAGQRPVLEKYLSEAPSHERGMLLAELLPLELECRLQRGEQPTVAEYARRLPDHGQLVKQLVGPIPGSNGPDPNPNAPPYQPPAAVETAQPNTVQATVESNVESTNEPPADEGPSLESTVLYGGVTQEDLPAYDPNAETIVLPGGRVGDELPELPESSWTTDTISTPPDPLTETQPAAAPSSNNKSLRTTLSERFAFAASFDHTRPPRLSDYQLLEQIGKGAMGVVYRAIHLPSGRMVAVKLIRVDLLDLTAEGAQVAIERFRLEARSGALLEHEHIIDVYEVGQSGRQYFYSMNHIDGPSLSEVVRQGPLESRDAALIMERVAIAIAHAHGHGILHRDLKPANILLDSKRRPYVADFGLAKSLGNSQRLTREGDILGTPGYMAPEQVADSSEVAEASDIYGLGATLFHLLTQRPPFVGDTTLRVIQQVLGEPAVAPQQVNPAVNPELSELCERCLSKDPTERPTSAVALAAALGRIAQSS